MRTTLLKMADQGCGLRVPAAPHSNRKCGLNSDWRRRKVYRCHSSKVIQNRGDNASVIPVLSPWPNVAGPGGRKGLRFSLAWPAVGGRPAKSRSPLRCPGEGKMRASESKFLDSLLYAR